MDNQHNIYISNFVENIIKWLNDNKIGKILEKRKKIARDMFWVCIDNNISLNDIDIIQKKLSDIDYIIEEGNLWEKLESYFENKKYSEFFHKISHLTPQGLNKSPNACCGKFELLYRLLRPNSIQPNKGDINDNGEKIELKGNETRISSDNITGKQYKKITSDIFSSLINGNTITKGGLKGTKAYEIEKKQYEQYYENEFRRKDSIQVEEAFSKLFKKLNINDDTDKLAKSVFNSNKYDQSMYQRILLNAWFKKYKSEFDKMILFGDGENVKIINDINSLNKCNIYADYFRINQTSNIGWYIK